ncbi:hypothetical protein ACFQE1_18945 [Halobium palmae]|uniref:DUF7130 domain-containing protein n=1 Tax=Halobium palmae TaxID=1776492 RepID=A0ABD5S4H7_9EURY
MTDDASAAGEATALETGTAVYDQSGEQLGVITGLTAEGFEVATDENVERVDETGEVDVGDPETESEGAAKTNEGSLRTSEQEQQPGQEFGEGYLMWRCDDCGEMGELEDGLPNECPDCGSEAVYRWRED